MISVRHRAAAHSLGQNVVFNIDRYDTLVMIYYYILYFLFSHYTVISLKIKYCSNLFDKYLASLCSLDAKYLSNRLLQYLVSPYVLVIRVFKPTFLLLISSNLTNRGFATETILWFPGDFLNVRHIKRRSKRTMEILTSRRHRAAAHSLGFGLMISKCSLQQR